MSIPKIIHYCWLSGESYPELVQKCIESWKRFLPDYEIILWDKKRFDIHLVPWVEQACAEKKWAFAADYIRLYALYNYGGIYLDSDVEVLKSFDDLLERNYFIGRENHSDVIEAAVMGAEPGLCWIKESLDAYANQVFSIAQLNNPQIAIPFILKRVLKNFPQVEILDASYFSPKNNRTGSLNIASNTYTIHHFNGDWFSDYQKKYFEIRSRYSQRFGKTIGLLIATLFSVKHKLMG